MWKYNKNSMHLGILSGIGLVMILGLLFIINSQTIQQSSQILPTRVVLSPTHSPISDQPQVYHSDRLKVTITVPSGFTIDDHSYEGLMEIKNNQGQIDIDIIG